VPLQTISRYGDLTCDTTYDTYERVIPTSLVIVPHACLEQWEDYAIRLCGKERSRVLVMSNSVQKMRAVASGDYDLVLVSHNMHKRLMGRLNSDYKDILFQRLVVDEADTIDLSQFRVFDDSMPRAAFTWLLTATSDALLTGARGGGVASLIRNPNLPSSSRTADERLDGKCRIELGRAIVVRCDPVFVQASLRLPEVIVPDVVRAERPRGVVSFASHVPQAVMQAMDACDVSAAVALLRCPTEDSEDGLLVALTAHLNAEAASLQAALEQEEADLPVATQQSLMRGIARLRRSAADIVNRVKNAECCPIGLDPIQVKAVTPCCKNAFEFANLLEALRRVARCPLCKTHLEATNITVVSAASTSTDRAVKEKENKTKPERVRDVVLAALAESPEARVLVFTEFDTSCVDTILRSAGVESEMLTSQTFATRWTQNAIPDTLASFRSGKRRVLLMSAVHFGSGLNLEFASHVVTVHAMSPCRYTQLVGRAQRPGRTAPLRVMNIRYEGENITK